MLYNTKIIIEKYFLGEHVKLLERRADDWWLVSLPGDIGNRANEVLVRASVLLPVDEPVPFSYVSSALKLTQPEGTDLDLPEGGESFTQSVFHEPRADPTEYDSQASPGSVDSSHINDALVTSIEGSLFLPAYRSNEAYDIYRKMHTDESSTDLVSPPIDRKPSSVEQSAIIVSGVDNESADVALGPSFGSFTTFSAGKVTRRPRKSEPRPECVPIVAPHDDNLPSQVSMETTPRDCDTVSLATELNSHFLDFLPSLHISSGAASMESQVPAEDEQQNESHLTDISDLPLDASAFTEGSSSLVTNGSDDGTSESQFLLEDSADTLDSNESHYSTLMEAHSAPQPAPRTTVTHSQTGSNKRVSEYANLPAIRPTPSVRPSKVRADGSWLDTSDTESANPPDKSPLKPRKINVGRMKEIEAHLAVIKPPLPHKARPKNGTERLKSLDIDLRSPQDDPRSSVPVLPFARHESSVSFKRVPLEGDILSTAAHHGPIKFKMCYDKNKRAVKHPHWVECYAVLLQDGMFHLYKDLKSATKSPECSARSTSFVEAHFTPHLKSSGLNYTKKSHVIVVLTKLFAIYLIDSLREKDCTQWLDCFQRLGMKQMPIIEHPIVGQRRENNSRYNKFLARFFKRRPAYADVKGYMKELVFGSDLSSLCLRENRQVPSVVTQLISVIEERGLTVDGLYRINGNMASVTRVRHMLDHHREATDLLRKEEIHVLTGTFKMFFRELKTPLISEEVYRSLLPHIHNTSDQEVDADVVRKQLRQLPIAHGEVLSTLLRHLNVVISHSAENKMSMEGLAICFSPNLVWLTDMDFKDPTSVAYHTTMQKRLIQDLLTNYTLYFTKHR